MTDDKEVVWTFIEGDLYGTITASQRKWINKVNKYAKLYPDEVKIQHINPDGSLVAHAPEMCFKFVPPKKRKKKNISEEQRKILSERMTKLGKGRSKKKDIT